MVTEKKNTMMRAELMEVTPALAREWLSKNHNNRPLKKTRIEIYARDIKENRWTDSNDAVSFGQDGTLYNGQNRLAAVILANRSVRMLVVRGFVPNDRLNMDNGVKRSAGDSLTIVYGGKKWARKAAIARSISQLITKRRDFLTNDDLKKIYDSYAAGIDYASTLPCSRNTSFHSAVAAGIAFAYAKNPEAVMDFADRTRSGEGLKKNDPVLTFRDSLLNRTLVYNARETTLKTLRALMAHIKGEEMQLLKASENGYMFFAE